MYVGNVDLQRAARVPRMPSMSESKRCLHTQAYTNKITPEYVEVTCPACGRHAYYGIASSKSLKRLPQWVQQLLGPEFVKELKRR